VRFLGLPHCGDPWNLRNQNNGATNGRESITAFSERKRVLAPLVFILLASDSWRKQSAILLEHSQTRIDDFFPFH
jgi:hypothetical protein